MARQSAQAPPLQLGRRKRLAAVQKCTGAFCLQATAVVRGVDGLSGGGLGTLQAEPRRLCVAYRRHLGLQRLEHRVADARTACSTVCGTPYGQVPLAKPVLGSACTGETRCCALPTAGASPRAP